MDRKVTKKKWEGKKKLVMGLSALGLLLLVFLIISLSGKGTLEIDEGKVVFATVTRGDFQEYVLETGEVVPSRTYFLDAVEGGNIIQVFKESGAIVKQGDSIARLENANLRLNVLAQENSLNEQINRIRTTRLQLDQNNLSQKNELAQIENLLQILTPQYYRDSTLYSKGVISKQQMERTEADYKFNLKRREFTYESYRNDSSSRLIQLQQLSSSEQSMVENLKGVRGILDNLIIKAPIDGRLSTAQLQEGQNVTKGQRIGQVDILGSYKIRVPIDEIYLSRIKEGLKATTTIDNKKYTLVINYIYPTVENGDFDVDMEFQGEIPQDILSGQSIRLKIELGKPSQELLIPVGGFYNDTGGNWIFVVDGDNKAKKRNIRLGIKNVENYQVLDGVNEGDKVIISSYKNFGESTTLTW